jgi:hypothetical protein
VEIELIPEDLREEWEVALTKGWKRRAELIEQVATLTQQLAEAQAQVARLKAFTFTPGHEFPQDCPLCGGTLEDKSDRDWHGLGNCCDICDACGGSGHQKHDLNAFARLHLALAAWNMQNPSATDDERLAAETRITNEFRQENPR